MIPSFPTLANRKMIIVRTPKALHYIPDVYTQVIEDLPNSTNLKAYLSNGVHASAVAAHLGRALGEWISHFHRWGKSTDQNGLREELCNNVESAALKFSTYYGRLNSSIDRYPEILRQLPVEKVIQRMKGLTQQEGNGIIHGDFWTGKCVSRSFPVALRT